MTKAEIHKYESDGVLTPRQAEILYLRIDLSQRTVARALGISRSTVRSLEDEALAKVARIPA